MESSAIRKTEELKKLNQKAREAGYAIQSPFYNDEINNPCIKEQNLSARCSIEYNGDQQKCADFKENYVLCVKFWDYVKERRGLESEYPLLPPPEEREYYKKFYCEEFKRIARDIMDRRRRILTGNK